MKFEKEYLIYVNTISAHLAGVKLCPFYTTRPEALAQAQGLLMATRFVASAADSYVMFNEPLAYWRFEDTLQKLLNSVERPAVLSEAAK